MEVDHNDDDEYSGGTEGSFEIFDFSEESNGDSNLEWFPKVGEKVFSKIILKLF